MAHEVKCADTVSVLTEWKETLTVKRPTTTYNAQRIASQTWATVDTFLGDWQPAGGATMRNEAGLSAKSDAVVIAPCDADVQEHDRVYRDDGTFMYVTYIWDYEDHKTVHLRRTESSQ